jgi:PAS domain S-box-containing protein
LDLNFENTADGKNKKEEIEDNNSKELLSILIETAEDFIFSLDGQGKFLSVNNYGSSSLDYKPEEMIGKHFLEFVDNPDRVQVAKSFQEVLKSSKVTIFEVPFVSRFGRKLLYEIKGRSVIRNGNIAGMIGIGRNITLRRADEARMKDLNSKLVEANRLISIERDRAKQKISVLEELNRLKNEFVSNISHELRTPLASIIGFSETISLDPAMPEETRNEFIEIILREGKRLAKLINDILDLSKIEGGKIELKKSNNDVIKILNEAIEAHQKMAEQKNITFTYEIPQDEILLYCDKERIFQAFSNIINNAIKFTGEKGRVKIIAQNFYKEIEVIVSDTGAGIPAKDIPHIFDKFYRVERPGTEIAGAGLGLVFVKQIVDSHNGLVTVHSEVNKGTTFVVKLPKSRIINRGDNWPN